MRLRVFVHFCYGRCSTGCWDTEVIECLLFGPAQARGGLPTARSQLAVVGAS